MSWKKHANATSKGEGKKPSQKMKKKMKISSKVVSTARWTSYSRRKRSFVETGKNRK